MNERGDDGSGEPSDDFITLPPGMEPPALDTDSSTRRVTRGGRDDVVFVPATPGMPVAPPAAAPATPIEALAPVAVQPTSPARPPAPIESPAPTEPPASIEAPAARIPTEPVVISTRATGIDDAEATRFTSRAAVSWRILLPGGDAVVVDTTLYLGRNPAVPDGDPAGRAVAMADPGKSMSKTHARFEVDGDRLLVTDLDSTNGVWFVSATGEEQELTPGEPTSAPLGADVELGDVALRIERR